MNTGGWIFMILSWIFIIGLALFCFGKIFCSKIQYLTTRLFFTIILTPFIKIKISK